MVPNAEREDGTPVEPDLAAIESVTGYEDGEQYVIRDEEHPDAWLRSDLVRELGR